MECLKRVFVRKVRKGVKNPEKVEFCGSVKRDNEKKEKRTKELQERSFNKQRHIQCIQGRRAMSCDTELAKTKINI